MGESGGGRQGGGFYFFLETFSMAFFTQGFSGSAQTLLPLAATILQ